MVVRMTELLESNENKQSGSMTVPIGIDKSGAVALLDIHKAPHIMIGGTTGSGKTVMLHNIINGLISKNTPEQLQFVLIDPKRIEFNEYEESPYLVCPVIKDCYQAIAALKCVSDEIDRRFDMFAENNVRKYDQMIPLTHEAMPQIVVVMDECVDLMLREWKITKERMTEIARIGRAAGVHLIVASQCHIPKVFYGNLKALIPTRMAFRVYDTESSLVLLDKKGAEKLTESGNCLLLRIGERNPEYIRAAYLSADEIKAISGTKATNSDELRRFDAAFAEKINVQTTEDAEAIKNEKKRFPFSESDCVILENMDEEVLNKAIEYLKATHEVLWMGDDRQTKMPLSELRKRDNKCQLRPYYPPEITDLAHMLLIARERNLFRNEDEADPECQYPTFCSPTDIDEYITFEFVRDHICDGAFGRGIENGKYLKMLLHLQDCVSAWKEENNKHI